MNVSERLRRQNSGDSWADCNLRGRPRPHHWRPDVQVRDTSGRITAWYWACARCPVSSRTAEPVAPRAFLRGVA